ncbi:MAG TPA: LamG domain-containing protein [Candidatus Saccharimonadales bacterium]|jgi:hypothetical protein
MVFTRRRRLTKKAVVVLIVCAVGLALLAPITYAALGGAPKNAVVATDVELQKGLIGHWKLDGNAKDSSPFARDGTLNGAPADVADRKTMAAGAKSFNGSSQYMTVANMDPKVMTSNNYGAEWSLSIWAKGGSQGSENVLLGKDGCNGGITTGVSTEYRFQLFNSDCSAGTYIDTAATDTTKWHLLTATYAAGAMRLYLDGTLAGSLTAASIYPYTNVLGIGSGGSSVFWYAGQLDDARVYNRALNAAEAKALFDQYDPGLRAAAGENGLVGHWKLDGNVKDATPNGANGTANSASLTTDRKGAANSAYSFNGTTSSIVIPHSTAYKPTSAISVGVWAKFTNVAAGGFPSILSNTEDGGGWSLYVNNSGAAYGDCLNGNLCFDVSIAGIGYQVIQVSRSVLTSGSWANITATYDGTIARLYVNGQQVATNTFSGAINTNTSGVCFGDEVTGSASCADYKFAGSIDEVRIYNRALTAPEVAAQATAYNANVQLSDLQKGLVGDWPMNGNAKDSTPQGNNGLVTAATLTTDRKGRLNSAYSFNGTNAYILAQSNNNIPAVNGAKTVTGWFNTTKTSGIQVLMALSDTGTCTAGLAVVVDTNKFAVYRCSVGSIIQTAFTATNSWHHFAYTYDGTTNNLYLDNVAVSPNTTAVGTGTVGYTIFGNERAAGSIWYSGQLDDIRIYNRALSATEVTALNRLYR